MRKYLERKMDIKIREKIQQVSQEYRQAEKNLVDSIDQWELLAHNPPHTVLREEIIDAGDALAESADTMLQFYRWQPKT